MAISISPSYFFIFYYCDQNCPRKLLFLKFSITIGHLLVTPEHSNLVCNCFRICTFNTYNFMYVLMPWCTGSPCPAYGFKKSGIWLRRFRQNFAWGCRRVGGGISKILHVRCRRSHFQKSILTKIFKVRTNWIIRVKIWKQSFYMVCVAHSWAKTLWLVTLQIF